MQYFVYIIFSEKYNKYYIGQTNDFNQRLLRHNLGQNESTKPYRPWKLLLTIEKKSRAEAVQLEKKLKNLTKIRLNQFIIKNSNNNLSAGADDPDSVGMSAC
jgi:putative endonuclease